MKAIGFFLAVFLSMLTVFLVATGEVKRWFIKEQTPLVAIGDVRTLENPGGSTKNIFEFPFYDFEQATLKFVIRAEFIQEEFGVNSQIDKIEKLSLRNGVIEIPLADEVPPVLTSPLANPRKLTLEFESAVYDKQSKDQSGKNILEVLLRQGKGTTEDGTRFDFEEMVFGEKGPQTYYLRSSKPVSIRGPVFGVHSPTGLDGTLEQHSRADRQGSRHEFLLLPPVRALIDPESASPPATRSPEDRTATAEPDANKEQLLATTCQGPLVIVRESGSRVEGADPNPRVQIRFEKDVVVYPVSRSVTLETLPAPRSTRFDCQRLTLDLETRGGKILPVRAAATWEGGRVKASFRDDENENADSYTIDGERLDWQRTPREPNPGNGQAREEPPRKEKVNIYAALADSEAVLSGKPVLRSRGREIHADRAIYRPAENRAIFYQITGTLEQSLVDGRDGKRGSRPTDDLLDQLGLSGANKDAVQSTGERPAGDGTPRVSPGPDPKVPTIWDLKADEAEVVFSTPAGEKSTDGLAVQKTLARIVARSSQPDGVQVKSRSMDPHVASGSVLTFLHLEKKVVLEGSGGVKPRFVRGEDWIEAEKIHVFHQTEQALWFENQVKARVKDISSLKQLNGRKPELEGQEKSKPSDTDSPVAHAPVDIQANFLSVRFLEARSDKAALALRDVVATGSRDQPLLITVEGKEWCRFSGREFYWDQDNELAQLVGYVPMDLQDLAATPSEDLARIQLEGGELAAQKILFQQKTWKAYLTNLVRIRSTRMQAGTSEPALELQTGKTEVEFFPNFTAANKAAQNVKPVRSGLATDLDAVKAMRSERTVHSALKAKGFLKNTPFAAQAEEASWSHDTRELRFHGAGEQEIELLSDSLRGPIRAREAVYDDEKGLLVLRGNVHGNLEQQPAASAQLPTPAGQKIRWQLDTSALEVIFDRSPQAASGTIGSVRARDKVNLRSEELGVQLRGDDLVFDHATMKVRIFSPDGRPQTMACDAARVALLRKGGDKETETVPPAKQEGAQEKVHKIVSQEITLLLHHNPHAVVQRGEIADWLLAEFDRDVIATFHIPERDEDRGGLRGAGDTLKMLAERLTLFVDPSQSPPGADAVVTRRLVPMAVANGRVVFTSGSLQATADRAVYQEEASRVTLYGSPARLSKDNQPVFAEPEISVWQEEGSFGAKYSKGESKPVKLPVAPK